MSGPITCIIVGDPIVALLSAAGIRAAEAIQQGYARAAELRSQHGDAREQARTARRDADRRGSASLAAEVEAAEARFESLIALAEQLGAATQVRATRPVRPEGTDYATGAASTRGRNGLADELQAILVLAAARLRDASTEQAAAFDVADEPMTTGGVMAQRLLARIAHLGPPPEHIAPLAKELERTPPGERAALLAMELRQRIQAYAEAAQQRLVAEATATIVRQSLKDLGYQVEDVADTLFVEGGTMHFRRAGWGDYMVRLRVDPLQRTANFNVVRAVDTLDNEATVLDHIAEDRWCAEFPALLKALEARGVRLDVTRRLPAGELPVQMVERDKLPRFSDEEIGAPGTKLRARNIG
jgi:F0F1-type ATP synthase membrane subunit b/b'